MKKFAVALIGLFASLTLAAGNPDFAHPRTTLKKAVAAYDSAIAAPGDNGASLVRSLLEIAGATSAIDSDSLPTVMPHIRQAAEACRDGATKAMVLLVEADVLNVIYTSQRYKYDNVNTPDNPLPADITEWNGRQFRSQIDSLSIKAFDLAAADADVPLSQYDEAVKADRLTLQYFPYAWSFVAVKALDLLSKDSSKAADAIADRCISLSRPQSPSWFYWTVNKYRRDDLEDNNDSLKALYEKYKDCEDAGYVLDCIGSMSGAYGASTDWLIPTIRDFVKRYPAFAFISNLRSRLAQLTRPTVSVYQPSVVTTGATDIKLSQKFSKTYGFKIYKVSAETSRSLNFNPAGSAPVLQRKFKADAEKSDTTVTIKLSSPGYYVIMPAVNDSVDRRQVSYFMCSTFLPVKIFQPEETAFVITDYTTGAPVKGVSVSQLLKNKASLTLGHSNSDGVVRFSPAKSGTNKRGSIIYNFADSRSDVTFSFYNYVPYQEEPNPQELHALTFADRQLYHPGDTVGFASVISIGQLAGNASVASGRDVKVLLKNVNNQPVDSLTLTSDNLGRISGRLAIPDDGLTGQYSISLSVGNRLIGNDYLTVSDFKLPTFEVDSLSAERDVPVSGSVTVRGRAMTYSGMPVAGAKVEAEIWGASRWRWFSPSRRLGNLSATTDASGYFSIVVADSLTARYPDKDYIAQIVVTSAAGEAQRASKSFTTGKPYTITFSGNNYQICTDKPVADPFAVYNADGKNVAIALRWWLNREDDKDPSPETAVASGTCSSAPGTTIDFSAVPAGVYTISAAPLDSALAAPVDEVATLRLYSLKRNTLPSDTPLFFIENEYTTDDNGRIEIPIGVADDNTYIYCALCQPGRPLSLDHRRRSKGFFRHELSLADSVTNARLVVFTTLRGTTFSYNIDIKRPDRRKITLKGSSMRDRLTPRAKETWTLTLDNSDSQPLAGGLIATMFNSALNALRPYSMPQSFYLRHIFPNIILTDVSQYQQYSEISRQIRNSRRISLIPPAFSPEIGFGNDFGSIRICGLANSKSVARSYGAQAKYVQEGVKVSNALEVTADCEEEVAVSEDKADAGDAPQQPAPADFQYRDSEVLQGFWMPQLTFGDDGNAQLTFTVPDANTTWSFNAFAWTTDLRSATMVRDLVASKPVMVQPNLPRFLRVGDRARVLATVFNNTDSAATVSSVIELFNVSDGSISSTATSTDTIAARASAVIAIEVAAPADASLIGYRVRSTLGEFTDGEQAYIPVEPATSAVIESDAFYLNPGEASYEMKIADGRDMQSTLDYTSNPAWNVIRELPGLAVKPSSTAPEAARQLFGAATAAGMLSRYPMLAEVLRQWTDNPDSGALTSRLSQNDRLKAAVLAETPWVQAAASDSHRMARLALLFDKKETKKSLQTSLSTLRKLQQHDGGWSWGSWRPESSPWATVSVLTTLGRLNAIGYLPADKDIPDMVRRAVAYLETQFAPDQTTDRQFTYILSLFPDIKPSLRGSQIAEATKLDIVRRWKSSSTSEKAVDAQILFLGGYPSVARQIMGSLAQFAVPSKSRGVSFPSVSSINDYADLIFAFARITPRSPLVDGMRRWLTLRQQTTTDLASCDPTRLIAAFTACGSEWLASSDSRSVVTVGSAPISVDNAEFATGHIVADLPADAAGKLLSVTRVNTAGPAYGAVISRYTAASAEVKAAPSDDISVEKRITAFRDCRWQYVDRVRLGEQVRILLTIKTTRDLSYVIVIDGRPAAFEPVDQLPGWTWSAGAGFYRENENSSTNLFIDFLPKGTYQITIDMTASLAGTFTSGIATVQSQLAPSVTAHSAGSVLTCE